MTPGSFSIRLQHVAPGRTDGKGCVDQTHVGIRLGKIAALLMSAGDEVFRQEADVIARRHDAIEDGTGVIDVSQFELTSF